MALSQPGDALAAGAEQERYDYYQMIFPGGANFFTIIRSPNRYSGEMTAGMFRIFRF